MWRSPSVVTFAVLLAAALVGMLPVWNFAPGYAVWPVGIGLLAIAFLVFAAWHAKQ